jgi:hypothetical protein
MADRIEIARLEEKIEETSLGVFCLAGLLVNTLIWATVFVSDSSSGRLAAWGTLMVAGNVLFGLGFIAGRRRTYIVTRAEQGD